MSDLAVARALVAEFERRVLVEGVDRLERCLELLSEEDVWWRPNEASNSAGNLVLHLEGNVRQWILTGLGGQPDERQRSREFAARGPIPKAELLARMRATLGEVKNVLDGLDLTALAAPRQVQGFAENGVSILVHVAEHFSYHVGQVSYLVKAGKGVDLGYYRGVDLERKGETMGDRSH